jgi:hypothetical protein
MAQERLGRAWIIPPSGHPCSYFHSLCNHIVLVIPEHSPSSRCYKNTLRQIRECWKFVFHLPRVGEVGGEILFGLRVLNSVWILLPAVEGKGPLCFNGCVGTVATRGLLGYHFVTWFGWYCPMLCD